MSTKEIRIFIAAAVHNVIHLTLNRLCSSKYKLHKYQQGCMPCPVRYILFFKYIPEKSALCEVEVQTKSYYQIAKVNIWFILPKSCESLLEKNVMKFKLRFSFLFLLPTFNFFWAGRAGMALQWHMMLALQWDLKHKNFVSCFYSELTKHILEMIANYVWRISPTMMSPRE